jgi:hypothetical protein
MKKVLLVSALFMGSAALAQDAAKITPKAMLPGTARGAQTIEQVQYNGMAAWRLSDGTTEAVVVPQIGRVMSFGKVGGANWLWNNAPEHIAKTGWKNYGGDKTWPAPQIFWEGMSGQGWPPPAAWDGLPHRAGVKDGKLWMVGPVQKPLGVRAVRQFWFEANGDFVVEQAGDKVEGAPVYMSLWSVVQIPHPDAIFLPINPDSPYKNNFHWIYPPKVQGIDTLAVTPHLLRVLPSAGTSDNNFKIGTDAPVSAAVAVKDGVAFVVRSNKPGGEYPDGALTAGFPVELWNSGAAHEKYNELELLSPLRLYKKGNRWRHTIRWSLHALPTKDINSPQMAEAIEKILQ